VSEPSIRGWVLLDVGNVLIPVRHGVVSETIQEKYFDRDRQTSADRAALHRFIFEFDDGVCRNAELDRGASDLSWLRDGVCQRFGISISESEFAEVWSSVFEGEVNADVIECVRQLRSTGFDVALCSNTNREHWSFLVRQYVELRRLSQESRCFLSFEMGMTKTDAGFFDAIATSTRAPRTHHILIDDIEANCLAARAAGMGAIVYPARDVHALATEVMSLASTLDSALPLR
jgi:putative hydrolase of the HAD superfamily